MARGLFTEGCLDAMHERLTALLAAQGVRLDCIYACPHDPDGTVPAYRMTCACRKPAPGTLHQAARDLGLNCSRSWTVGDSFCDIAAGRAAGTLTALVGAHPHDGEVANIHCTTTVDALHAVLGPSR
ncbi:HAD-IIIA family hydrolase [Streptomyces sp. NPDC001939]